jgi:(1->4)-alpha-D-glucan 1-alpha-D-glucosylmutase
MQAYMRKALKEAKRHTSWLHENVAYEQAVDGFVRALLSGSYAPQFLASFVPFQRRVAWFGMINSLAQLVLRVGAPGVPDVFQGSELWNFSLVDPDNRQPVDFEMRRRALTQLDPLLECEGPVPAETLRELLNQWPDGRIKLYTLTKALRSRRAHADLFHAGEYEPLASDEDPHLIGFSRRHQNEEMIVLAPRFMATMLGGVPRLPLGMDVWRTTSIRLPRRLSTARFANVFTGETIDPIVHRGVPWLLAGSAFQSWPMGMLRVLSA